jgi:hypothetical protein
MSDWQRCVDWFLAKYCRCRLQLDWCWCRWRTSAKGRCRWILQVWKRQVGLVWGTRWLAGSRRAARWQEQQDEVEDGFLVEPQNQGRAGTSWEPSHECWLAEATSSSRGLRWFTRKPSVYSAEPQSRGEDRVWLSGQNRPDRFVEPVWPIWGCRAPKTSRQRTHVGIARLASRLREVRSPGIRPMVLQRKIPKVPLVGVYPSLVFRGILVFWLASI